MSKVLQERGFGSLPRSTEANPRNQVKSISTTIEADSCPIRRIGSSQYAVSTRENRTLMYETRQMTIPFLSCLNGYYCEENKGSYGPQFSEAYFEALRIRSSISVMPLSTYLNLGLGELAHTKLTVELADRTVKYLKGIAKNVLVGIGKFVFLVEFIILDMPEDIKVPLILERPFLSTACAKIDVYKRKITLRFLRERMELDLEARLMGETWWLNIRIRTPFFDDYNELNDLNEPFELRRNQGDNLKPTIKEGEVIEEFRTVDDELDTGIVDYPSYCDYYKNYHIDCAAQLKFILHIRIFNIHMLTFFPLMMSNVISKKFHNSIMKDKMVYRGNNVVGALINVPIFVGTFSIVTDFIVLEDMDVLMQYE
ncbi:putative reverse transcriptase domain-containing protein [Tanacetum coccineum]